jgi:Arc/MetJ-type ribon-helix-helix transcriptional regulator
MDVGVLTTENKSYLEQYKVLGFKSKTEMINQALETLRKKLKQEERRERLLKAGKSYAQDNSYAWGGLDGDDFED